MDLGAKQVKITLNDDHSESRQIRAENSAQLSHEQKIKLKHRK
jgi:hypothetical protein